LPTNPFEFQPSDVLAFVLVLVRASGLFLSAPVFASRNIPTMAKASWILLVAFLVFPVVDFAPEKLPEPGLAFAIAVVRELLVGFVIGFGATLLFTGIQLAGQIVDIQMGLGMVNIIDPITSTQISVMGQYYFLVATLVFMAVDGHHVLLKAVVDSFGVIPLGGATVDPALGGKLMALFGKVFFIAFRVGAPVIGALFITNMALGIIARTVPQMNVFIVGMPLNIAVGFLMVTLSMGFFVFILQGLFDGMYRDLKVLILAMR
jgi:flagellar biosynthetic protein FliR